MKNNKSTLIIVGVVLAITVAVGGLFLFLNQNSDNELDNRVAEDEKAYAECMAKVEANENILEEINTQIENEKLACERLWIKSEGFNDDIDCIGNYDDPICESTERYNAEVYGGNHCNGITEEEAYGEKQIEAGIQASYDWDKVERELKEEKGYLETLNAMDCLDYK